MKLTSKPLAAIIVVILFGGILLTANLGWFQTTTTKIPATYPSGEFAGQYNPADIRGSYLFGDITNLFDVPVADLQTAFLLPASANPAAYGVKNLEAQFAESGYEIGTGSVRMFVAFYKGLPYDLSQVAYLPKEAAQILTAQGKMTAEQVKYLSEHTVDLSKPAAVAAATVQPENAAQPTTAATRPATAGTPQVTPGATHVAADRTVTSKTTFQELLTWGVPQAAIEKVLGGSMPAAGTVIKDYLAAKGLEFSSIKAALQVEVDKTK